MLRWRRTPAIQAYVTGQAMEVIGEQIDIATITSDLIDGITALGTGPRATEALELLKGPAAAGVQSLIESGVTGFVESEAFSNVWATALRVSHAQLERAMGADPAAALQLGDDGSIGIQLGPIIAAVKAALLERGIGLANQIPAVDRTIVIAQSDSLATVRLAYGVVVAAGSWLPWVAILLLALGVAVARRRAVALIWAAVALALAMLLSLAGLGIGSIALVSTLSPAVLPAGIVGLLYETVAGDVRATAIAVLVLAIVVAAVGWLAGPFDMPRRLRGLTRDAAGAIRGAAERRGVTTGGFGAWIFARRRLLRAIVAVVAAAVVLLVRPLTIGVTLWTLVLALLVLALLEVLERPTIAAPQAAERRGSEQRAVGRIHRSREVGIIMSSENPVQAVPRSAWAAKWVTFAALMLLVNGIFSVLQGLAAVIGPDTYYAVADGELFLFDVQGWGWWNLILGALLVATAFGLFSEARWARVTALVLVIASAVIQMLLLPLQPWWAFIVIAIDMTIIYAIVVRSEELREPR